MYDGIHRIHTPGVIFHLLRDRNGLVLIDAGFVGGLAALRRTMRERGWENEPISGIIITHGHLDHILNVGKLARETGAWIAAPRLDLDHYSGKPTYAGLAKVTGILESLGRPLLGFQPFAPDRLLDDGDVLDVWEGLRVVHLPGHTAGHCGLYSEKHRLLFSADLFASGARRSFYPPAIFNSFPDQMPASVCKALSLNLTGVLPNHGDDASPSQHLQRLLFLSERGS